MSTSSVDIPTMTDNNGNKEWRLNGELHREDGPAAEYINGYKAWYIHGKRHREDGPAIERVNGDKWWYLNGKRHREDGPAIEDANGANVWFLNGERHREDGPALVYYGITKGLRGDADVPPSLGSGEEGLYSSDDDGYVCVCKVWYLNGNKITEEEHCSQTSLVKRAI
jgi:hypothetical protein